MTPLEKILIRHEGLRLHPYTDTRGKLTIGVGRNLIDNGIDKTEAMELLRHDIADIYSQILTKRNEWILDFGGPVRRDVVIMMIFNMGMRGFQTFKRAIKAMKREDWNVAAMEMLNSKWSNQVGRRADVLAEMMRRGRYG